jgi:hypothetical protein
MQQRPIRINTSLMQAQISLYGIHMRVGRIANQSCLQPSRFSPTVEYRERIVTVTDSVEPLLASTRHHSQRNAGAVG